MVNKYNDIYSGSLGTFVDKDKIVNSLNEYIVNSDGNLNYEFSENRIKLVIITGKNKEEEALPNWEHPVVFNNVRHEETIGIDLRPFMKGKLDDIINVKDKLQDKYNGTIQLYRMVFTKLILEEDTFWLKNIKTSLMEMFADIISTTTTMIVYDKTVSNSVKIVSKLHILSLIDGKREQKLQDLVMQLPKEDVMNLIKKDLKDLYAVMSFKSGSGDFILPSTTIGSLVNNIKVTLDSDRTKGLNTDIYIQSLSRGFFSLDSKNLAIGMIEDLPTLITILIMSMTEGINSKSNFRKIIEANKRTTKPKEFIKTIVDTYNRESIDL